MAEDSVQNVQTSSGGSSSGIGEGYAQAGASTFNTAVSWLTYGQERERMQQWRSEDMALAQQAQQYALQQQGFENQMAREGMGMQQDAFDFGKFRWGEEFGFTRKQYQDQLKMQKSQERRTQEGFDMNKRKIALGKLTNQINKTVGDDVQMRQLIASNYGA